MCKKLINNSQPFGKKCRKTAGGIFFDSHCTCNYLCTYSVMRADVESLATDTEPNGTLSGRSGSSTSLRHSVCLPAPPYWWRRQHEQRWNVGRSVSGCRGVETAQRRAKNSSRGIVINVRESCLAAGELVNISQLCSAAEWSSVCCRSILSYIRWWRRLAVIRWSRPM